MVSVTYFILRFAIVQNECQQTNINRINHINDNYIKCEVYFHFGRIWPTVRRGSSAVVVAACGAQRRLIEFLEGGEAQTARLL